jgi:hypothetical protein
MSVVFEVPVQDLINGLFRSNLSQSLESCYTYIQSVLVLGEHVDEADLSGLLCEAPDHVSVGISPPRDREDNLVPLRVGLSRGQVQVATLWAVDLSRLRDWVHIGTRL